MYSKETVFCLLECPEIACYSKETDLKIFPGALILLEESHFTVREILDGPFGDPG